MNLADLIDVNALYSKVVTFYDSGNMTELLDLPIVFPIQTIHINIKMIRKDSILDTFRNVVSIAKLYRNNLIKVTYNGVNTQSYITDRSTAAGFIDMYDRQNGVIFNLLLLETSI